MTTGDLAQAHICWASIQARGVIVGHSFRAVAVAWTRSVLLRVQQLRSLLLPRRKRNTPRHESQLHLMMAKGWSTCRLCRSSFVTTGTRHHHLSHQSYPALLPEHRQWIPAHHPCCYLCLTARKRKIKAQLQGVARARLFPVSKRESLHLQGGNVAILQSLAKICPDKVYTHTRDQPPLPLVFGWFNL